MGNIIAAVAVFEIHMEMKAVATMNPSTSRRGLVPTADTMARAIRRCSPQRSMVTAMKNPPMKRKISSLA